MKIATYLRVSTASQTLAPQREELAAYAASKGWTITEEYSDVISGAKANRKGFDRLLADAKSGKINAVLAVKIDRLARSVIHFSQIVEDFAALGVALVIPGQNIDTRTSNPAGRLTMNILASVAAFERDLIKERTRAGLQSARQRGVVLGRPTGTGRDLPTDECRAAMAKGQSIRAFCRAWDVPLSTMRLALNRTSTTPRPSAKSK